MALTLGAPLAYAEGVEVGFSRGDPSAKEVVLKAVKSAQNSLHVAAYQYTEPDILAAVIEASRRGVEVAVVLDKTQGNSSAQADLVAAGIACRVDKRFKIMHHKFMIIDGVSVESGSFNYTRNGDVANAENALLIRDNPMIAAKYKAEWDAVFNAARPCSGVAAPRG